MSGSLYQSCRLPALSPYYLFSLWGEGSQAHTPIFIHSSQRAAHWCAQLQQRYQQQYFPLGAEIWETASAGTQGGQGEKEMLEPRNQVVVCKAGGWLRARLLGFLPMMFLFLGRHAAKGEWSPTFQHTGCRQDTSMHLSSVLSQVLLLLLEYPRISVFTEITPSGFPFHWEHLPLLHLSMESWSNATSSQKLWKPWSSSLHWILCPHVWASVMICFIFPTRLWVLGACSVSCTKRVSSHMHILLQASPRGEMSEICSCVPLYSLLCETVCPLQYCWS